MKFVKFYFEGNERWGIFNTPADVLDLLNYYDYETLRKAEKLNYPAGALVSNIVSFGFYLEYRGKTFGEWIDENNQGIFFDIKKERQLKLNKINENVE